MASAESTDVAICGGGMAGLTLALQLARRRPQARISVLEPTRRPLPEACFKVGESTVEIGARYLGEILGLHEHMLSRHLRKNGLRFFSGAPGAPLQERAEMGPREPPNVPAYQIDRGRFENDLRALCEQAGVDLREGWGARDVALQGGDGGLHRLTAVRVRGGEAPVLLDARWVVDATGRRRMLQKKLGLHRPLEPQASAAWFRVADKVDVAELVPAAARDWHERDVDRDRWLSTNHLTGHGYWVWLIPLGSGHTSVGVVAESDCHDYASFSTEPAMRAWLAEHEPSLAARLDGVPLADFLGMRDYRYGSERVLSADRWACVGEAGLFVDPLYSPGADMIALGNCIAAETILRDLGGEGVDPEHVDELNGFFLSWAAMLTRTLAGGSRAMRSPEVFAAKLYWDYLYYWAMMCPYFFGDLYRLPPAEHRRFGQMLGRWRTLNEHAQRVLRAWEPIAPDEPTERFVGLPQPATTLSDLHLRLLEPRDAEQIHRDMEEAYRLGQDVVVEILLRALRRAGPAGAAALAEQVELQRWAPEVSEERLAAEEAEPRKRRKLLPKHIRDMERSIGKMAGGAEAVSLRELWSRVGP